MNPKTLKHMKKATLFSVFLFLVSIKVTFSQERQLVRVHYKDGSQEVVEMITNNFDGILAQGRTIPYQQIERLGLSEEEFTLIHGGKSRGISEVYIDEYIGREQPTTLAPQDLVTIEELLARIKALEERVEALESQSPEVN